jgi:alkylation response protein AidB-like acyl-CoA dehydrogenase
MTLYPRRGHHQRRASPDCRQRPGRRLRRDSALRDRERRLPLPELDVFSRSGLWGISVPKEYGGAGVSNVTLAKVIALIAQAPTLAGQIPQNHFYALEVLRVNGSPEQKKRLYAEVLAGQRFGNALAELGTKTAHDRVTRLSVTTTAIASTAASSTPPARSTPSAFRPPCG